MRHLFFTPLILILVACGGMSPTVIPPPPTSVATATPLPATVAATPAGTATPTAGTRISTPFIDKAGDIALYTTTAPPLITAQDLPRVLTDNGVYLPMAPFDASKPIVPTLVHGVGTIGHSDDGSTATGCMH